MSPAEELMLTGHAVTARQISAAIDTAVDANPAADVQLVDTLTAISKLANQLSEELLTAANASAGAS